jgi:DNA-binding response OmpR family regulator
MDELLARVRAQLRRTEGRADQHLVAGRVSLDLAGRVAFKDDQPVALTAKEFKLAALLLRRAGRFVSKEEIDTALHNDEAVVSGNAIEVAVSSIRRKLGADVIITARGLGYMAPR